MMPDEPQQSQARKALLCNRCKCELEYLAAIPKRFDAPPYEIFRCVQCAEVRWVERDERGTS